MGETLYVKFWGTRGSCAAPSRNRIEYGGNTSCISAAWKGGLAVFDGGTGIVALGRQMEKEEASGETGNGSLPVTACPIHIFISHLHLDHISGLPLFSCFFKKNACIHIYGESRDGLTLEEALTKILGPPYWPVSFQDMPASICWHEIEAGREYALADGVSIRTMRAEHPDQCILYRLDYGKQSLVYGLDCEPTAAIWSRYREFAKSCSLLVFDAAYTEEEYPRYRGYGHGTWQQGIEMARQCGARYLRLTHHEWSREDQELGKLELLVRGLDVDAEFAREDGWVVLVDEPEE